MRIRFLKKPLVTAICGLGLSAAQAATFVVANTNDNGAGSLREAIANAPSNAEITFSPGLTGVITLGSSLSITDKSLIITGPGVDLLTISGADLYRIFDLNSTTETNSLTLSGLTLAHGRSGSVPGSCGNISGYGGAICARNVNLTVTDSVFDQNVAVSGGGAIASLDYDYSVGRHPNPVVIRRCFFVSNQTSGQGGAVLVYGVSGSVPATIDRSEFLNNSSTGSGGALTLYVAAATVNDSSFISNTATTEGGAILAVNWGAYVADLIGLTVTNSTFNNDQGGSGGAIHSTGQDLIINSSTLYGNHATTPSAGDNVKATALPGDNPKMSIHNSILAASPGDDTSFENVVPTISYSLVQKASGIPVASLDHSTTGIDPLIGPLDSIGTLSALNPRAMFGFSPPANSLVINAGDPSSAGSPSYDQRGVGYDRIRGGRVDMGAIESSYTVSVPGAPTLTRVVPNNESMALYFTVPGTDGGSAIERYTATCTRGGLSFPQTGTSSPITVVGLTKGASYSCWVRAQNGVGEGLPSVLATNVARPRSLVPVLSAVLE